MARQRRIKQIQKEFKTQNEDKGRLWFYITATKYDIYTDS